MQSETDWRHWVAGGAVVALLLAVGIVWLRKPAPKPTAPAPRGPHARLEDAPEFPSPVAAQGRFPPASGTPAAPGLLR